MGGKKADGHRTNTVEALDMNSNKLALIDLKLPKQRSGFASVLYKDQVILVGGNDGNVLNRVDSLSLRDMKWHSLPPMLLRRDELAVTVGPDMKIYAIGGYGGPDK